MNFTLTTDAGDLDLLGDIAGFASYEEVKAKAEELELFQHHVWVLTLDGLIYSKQVTGRPKDLRLLPELKALKALRDSEKDN